LYQIGPRASADQGELDPPELHPGQIVLMIGITNTWAAGQPAVDSVYAGTRAVGDTVHARKPEARIVLQSLLPTPDKAKDRDIVRVPSARPEHWAVTSEAAAYLTYIGLCRAFVDKHGMQLEAYFNDGVHPYDAGCRLSRDRLVPGLHAAWRPCAEGLVR